MKKSFLLSLTAALIASAAIIPQANARSAPGASLETHTSSTGGVNWLLTYDPTGIMFGGNCDGFKNPRACIRYEANHWCEVANNPSYQIFFPYGLERIVISGNVLNEVYLCP